MPVVMREEAAAPERRARTGRGLWLLLAFPPLLGVILLSVIAVRPLRCGSLVFASLLSHSPRTGWRAHVESVAGKQGPFPLQDGWYEIRHGGTALQLGLQDWTYGVGWFRGARVRK